MADEDAHRERDELLVAVTALAQFTDGLLDVMEKLEMLGTDARPTPEELARWRRSLDGWRESSVALRQRIGAIAHVPPDRMQ